jgi:signal transduction histidine kinase
MIGRLKAIAKRHWPRLRLRTSLLMTFLFVAALPGFGAVFLRVYENTLVRQTEAELVAQGAALAATAQALWPGAPASAPTRLRPEDFRPERTRIDLNSDPILPERPSPAPARNAASPATRDVAKRLQPVIVETARTTLASIQLLDADGRILTGSMAGGSYADVAEVRTALGGRPATVLRHNGAYRPRYALEWLSRASDIRIHHARPVTRDGAVVGALLLSRSPRSLFRGIYEDLGKILIGVGGILAILVGLSGLLSRGIARPIEQLSAATRDLASGKGGVPEPPPTAAVEIQALYRDFGRMAATIESRSRYLRDFAHAVSHEFKTPLAGIRGGIELLQDHHAGMSDDERRRFLANIEGDADRLAQLVSRLLDLARADMARPAAEEVDIEPIIRGATDALARTGLAIRLDLPPALPRAAVPARTIEASLVTLVDNSVQAGATEVRIAASAEGDALVIDLADDGPGVPAADRDRIFEPFFTSRRREGGSGLGLPIVRSLLQASRGTVELLPSERGARFRLRLPIAR